MFTFDVLGVTIKLPNDEIITIPLDMFIKYTELDIPYQIDFQYPEIEQEFLWEICRL